MIRRWLIRSLALTLLTLCVVAGVGSYWRSVVVSYHAGLDCIVEIMSIESRRFGLSWSNWPPIQRWEVGFWETGAWPRGPVRFMGFHVNERGITIPLWFPTLLSALLLWRVWRKTRPKFNGRGFPVEAAGKEA